MIVIYPNGSKVNFKKNIGGVDIIEYKGTPTIMSTYGNGIDFDYFMYELEQTSLKSLKEQLGIHVF